MSDNFLQKGDYLDILLRLPNTVFTTSEIAILWREDNTNIISSRLNYYVKQGKLLRIHRGLYAKNTNYSRFEVANKIYAPSYVSLETVLLREGVIFQWYDTIFSVGRFTRDITIDGERYEYRKIKDEILTNTAGIKKVGEYFIATKERAFLDRIYLNRNYYFDNIDGLNWDKCFELVEIYKNKSMKKALDSYYKYYKDNL